MPWSSAPSVTSLLIQRLIFRHHSGDADHLRLGIVAHRPASACRIAGSVVIPAGRRSPVGSWRLVTVPCIRGCMARSGCTFLRRGLSPSLVPPPLSRGPVTGSASAGRRRKRQPETTSPRPQEGKARAGGSRVSGRRGRAVSGSPAYRRPGPSLMPQWRPCKHGARKVVHVDSDA